MKYESFEMLQNNLYAAYQVEKQKNHTELKRAWRRHVL